MERAVTYYYPDADKAESIKMFQDRVSQIRGFFFTRDSIKMAEKLPSSGNHAIYFLFNDSEEDDSRVYVGQSSKGIERINEHAKTKEFWSRCLMFVSDNNSFDKLVIDYLEYAFIKKFQKSSYILTNVDPRGTEPIISVYDKPTINMYIDQIEFLLRAEGVSFITVENIKPKKDNVYFPQGKYHAQLIVSDGKFILLSGSEIKRPIESSKDWADKGKFYTRQNTIINEYLEDGKISPSGDTFILNINIAFKSPSAPACLISGRAENGWDFFKNLEKIR
jgi:hypothetical protein